ncbi:MAG: D-alanyl-D-alanine carboxypeptidase family protein [Pseudomonadota bacterium]
MIPSSIKSRKCITALLCLFGSASLSVAACAKEPETGRVPPASDAPIAYLIDLTNGQVLHERAADRRFVPASVTKVMTLYQAFELIEDGALDPAQVMEVSPDVTREWQGKGSTMFLEVGMQVQLGELLTGIANVSANDAAALVAIKQAGSVQAWTASMTATAHELGMVNSHFATPNGWPDEGRTFTTARDLGILARAMVSRHPRKFARYIGRPTFTFNNITQSNHDPLLGKVKGADGIKTGYTNEAGFGFLGTATRGGQRLALVLAGVARKNLRARLAQDYMEWGFNAFDRVRLFGEGQSVGVARVQNGSSRSVELVADGPIAVNLAKGSMREVNAKIVYDGPLRAPIAAGDEVAVLQITVEGMQDIQIPLKAKTGVGEAGIWARISNSIAGLFA